VHQVGVRYWVHKVVTRKIYYIKNHMLNLSDTVKSVSPAEHFTKYNLAAIDR